MSSTDADLRLKPIQLAALIVLMSEAREVTNKEFAELAGFTLTGVDRQGLEEPGYVESRKVDRALAFQLTDKGSAFCKQLHTARVNVGRSTAGRSIFVLLGGVGRSLDRLRVSHAEFFKQPSTVDEPVRPDAAGTPAASGSAGSPVVPASAAEVEAAIRAAYVGLPKAADGWVGLADLRERLVELDHLAQLDRSTVDTALRAMAWQPGVRIIPIANTKSLRPRDHAAALRIGDEENHALWIGQA